GNPGGMAHASAFGFGAGTNTCNISGWTQVNEDEVVYVNCFNATGSAGGSYFTANFVAPDSPRGTVPFALVGDANPTDSLPNMQWQHDNQAIDETKTPITVTHPAVGTYTVKMPKAGGAGGTVKVTAFGANPTTCAAMKWNAGTSAVPAEVVYVRCRSLVTGAP